MFRILIFSFILMVQLYTVPHQHLALFICMLLHGVFLHWTLLITEYSDSSPIVTLLLIIAPRTLGWMAG